MVVLAFLTLKCSQKGKHTRPGGGGGGVVGGLSQQPPGREGVYQGRVAFSHVLRRVVFTREFGPDLFPPPSESFKKERSVQQLSARLMWCWSSRSLGGC